MFLQQRKPMSEIVSIVPPVVVQEPLKKVKDKKVKKDPASKPSDIPMKTRQKTRQVNIEEKKDVQKVIKAISEPVKELETKPTQIMTPENSVLAEKAAVIKRALEMVAINLKEAEEEYKLLTKTLNDQLESVNNQMSQQKESPSIDVMRDVIQTQIMRKRLDDVWYRLRFTRMFILCKTEDDFADSDHATVRQENILQQMKRITINGKPVSSLTSSNTVDGRLTLIEVGLKRIHELNGVIDMSGVDEEFIDKSLGIQGLVRDDCDVQYVQHVKGKYESKSSKLKRERDEKVEKSKKTKLETKSEKKPVSYQEGLWKRLTDAKIFIVCKTPEEFKVEAVQNNILLQMNCIRILKRPVSRSLCDIIMDPEEKGRLGRIEMGLKMWGENQRLKIPLLLDFSRFDGEKKEFARAIQGLKK